MAACGATALPGNLVLIAWLVTLVLTVGLAIALCFCRARADAFANSPSSAGSDPTSSNMLPHPVQVTYVPNLDLICAATSVIQHALMYTATPAMSAGDATVSKFFVYWASSPGDVGKPISQLGDLGLNQVIDTLNASGWLSETDWPSTGSLATPSQRLTSKATRNRLAMTYSSLSNSEAARAVIDRGSPFAVGFTAPCETVNGKEVYPSDGMQKIGDIFPMPSPQAHACKYNDGFAGIANAYDTGKQAFYVLTNGFDFYLPFAYFDKYAWGLAIDSVGPAAQPQAPPSGSSVTAKITPGRPTAMSVERSGWWALASITAEVQQPGVPYNDIIVDMYDAVTTTKLASCQMTFSAPAADGSATLSVSAFMVAPYVSLTLALDGASTKLAPDAGTDYAERTFTFKAFTPGATAIALTYAN